MEMLAHLRRELTVSVGGGKGAAKAGRVLRPSGVGEANTGVAICPFASFVSQCMSYVPHSNDLNLFNNHTHTLSHSVGGTGRRR